MALGVVEGVLLADVDGVVLGVFEAVVLGVVLGVFEAVALGVVDGEAELEADAKALGNTQLRVVISSHGIVCPTAVMGCPTGRYPFDAAVQSEMSHLSLIHI